jgi:hypothetical protein
MNKQKVMEALLSAECNISGDVIGFIGSNLPDVDMEVIPFDHEQDHVFEACGIQEKDCAEMTEVLNNYMNSLPKNERQQSKAVEYIMNSGNARFMRIAVIAGLQKVRDNADESKSSDLNGLLISALLKRLRDKDEE